MIIPYLKTIFTIALLCMWAVKAVAEDKFYFDADGCGLAKKDYYDGCLNDTVRYIGEETFSVIIKNKCKKRIAVRLCLKTPHYRECDIKGLRYGTHLSVHAKYATGEYWFEPIISTRGLNDKLCLRKSAKQLVDDVLAHSSPPAPKSSPQSKHGFVSLNVAPTDKNRLKKLEIQCNTSYRGNICFEVANEYWFNKAKFQDAAYYYDKACYGEHPEGCYMAAYYHSDPDLGDNFSVVLSYFESACSLDHGKGCNDLAGFYSEGKKVEKNMKKAFGYYGKACNLDLASACFFVGKSYFNAEGTEKNITKGAEFVIKSCHLGFAHGCATAAEIYAHGVGVPPDKNMSVRTQAKACKLGITKSCSK